MPKNQSNKNQNKILKNKRINTGQKDGKLLNVESKIPKLIKKRTIQKINNLEIIKKKNNELSEKIIINNNQIQKEKEQTLEEIKKINSDIEKKNIDLKKVKNENLKLINKLNEIKNEVTKKINLISIKRIKDEDYEDKNKKLKIEIKIHEEEIKNLIQLIPQLQKEKEYFENIINYNNEETKYNLLNELIEINNEIETIKKDIKIKKEELKEHDEKCKKKIKKLEYEYNLLKNDLDFEKKKIILNKSLSQSKINHEIPTLSYLDDEIIEKKITSYKYKNYNTINTDDNIKIKKRENSFLNSNRKKFKLSTEGEERREKEKLRISLNPLWKDIKELNNNYKNYMRNKPIKYFFTEREKNNTVKSLFRNKELNILSKIIPDECLKNYSQKFNSIETEKEEINNDFKNEIKIKKQIYKNTNLKLNDSTNKMNKINDERKEINKILLNQKKKIKILNDKLKIENKNLKDLKYTYNIKYKENIKLSQHILFIKEQIDNGELVLSEKNNLNNEEENKEEKNLNEEKEEIDISEDNKEFKINEDEKKENEEEIENERIFEKINYDENDGNDNENNE